METTNSTNVVLTASGRLPNGRRPCKHCGVNIACKARGLCTSCHKDDRIRLKYPLCTTTKSRGTGLQNYNSPLPEETTTALPGTPEKLMVLEERARMNQSLFHPFDAVAVDADSASVDVSYPGVELANGRPPGPTKGSRRHRYKRQPGEYYGHRSSGPGAA